MDDRELVYNILSLLLIWMQWHLSNAGNSGNLFPDVDSCAVKFYHIKTASYHEKFHWGPFVFIRIHLFLDQWMYSPYYKLVFPIGKLLFAFTALCYWLAVISGNKNIISCNIPRWLLQDFGRKCYKISVYRINWAFKHCTVSDMKVSALDAFKALALWNEWSALADVNSFCRK